MDLFIARKISGTVEHFMTEVERQLNRNVKIIRSDRGGECYGRTTKISQLLGLFAKFLEKRGIYA